MISLENLKCPTCGAAVAPPPAGATSVRCGYCGNVAMVVAPQPRPVMPFPAPMPPAPFRERYVEEPARRPNPGAAVAAAVGIFVLAAGLIGLFVALDHGVGNKSFQWRTTVIPANVNGDAVEDFIGLYASRSEKDYPLYVAAFDGKNQSELWRAGPFGKAAHEIGLVLVGSHLVVTDARPSIHVLDLATGKDAGGLSLSDKVASTCVPTDSKNELWVETSDKRSLLVSLTGVVARAEPRPASCPPISSDCDHVRSARAGCKDGDTALKIDGFDAKFVLTQGNDAIAIGRKSPGTSTPMAVAYDATTQKVRWQRLLVGSPPSSFEADLHAVDMAGGRLFAEYVSDDPKAGRLMAIDARTGNVLWDVAVPNCDSVAEASEVVISPTRVYLPHWTWLDLFDVQTGKHVATLGAW